MYKSFPAEEINTWVVNARYLKQISLAKDYFIPLRLAALGTLPNFASNRNLKIQSVRSVNSPVELQSP